MNQFFSSGGQQAEIVRVVWDGTLTPAAGTSLPLAERHCLRASCRYRHHQHLRQSGRGCRAQPAHGGPEGLAVYLDHTRKPSLDPDRVNPAIYGDRKLFRRNHADPDDRNLGPQRFSARHRQWQRTGYGQLNRHRSGHG